MNHIVKTIKLNSTKIKKIVYYNNLQCQTISSQTPPPAGVNDLCLLRGRLWRPFFILPSDAVYSFQIRYMATVVLLDVERDVGFS